MALFIVFCSVMALSVPTLSIAQEEMLFKLKEDYKKLMEDYVRVHKLYLEARMKVSQTAKPQIPSGTTLEEDHKKLLGEYLRINKLYLEERLKNEQLMTKSSEIDELKKELEKDVTYCEKDSTGIEKELDQAQNELEKKTEEVLTLKATLQEMTEKLKSCPAGNQSISK